MKELRKVKSRYEFQLEGRQVVLIVSGLILVLMLSFLMGTLLGVNMGKTDNDAQVAATVPDDRDAAEREAPEGDADTQADATVSDEILSSPSEKQISKSDNSREDLIRELERLKVPDKVEGEQGAEKEAMSEKEPSPEPASDTSDKESTTVAKNDSAEGPSSSRKSAPAEKADSKSSSDDVPSRHVARAGTYTIQLASFPERADAAQMTRDLKGSMYDAYMVQVSLPDKGTFYRVRVGHYEDLAQAKKALAIIQSREGKFYDAWITQ